MDSESHFGVSGLALCWWRRSAQFWQLLTALLVAAYVCDADGLITFFNEHAVALWRRAPTARSIDRFCGSCRLFAVDGTLIPHDRCWMAVALAEGREFNGEEITIERADGSRVTVLVHIKPLRDEAGRVIAAVNLLVDISESRRASAAMLESQARFAAFAETRPRRSSSRIATDATPSPTPWHAERWE